jgi:GNAT superfamily N-acetyltransferase
MSDDLDAAKVTYSGTVSIGRACLADVPELAALEAARLLEAHPPEERARKGFIVTALGPARFAEVVADPCSTVLVAKVTELDGPWTPVGFAVMYGPDRAASAYPYLDLFRREPEKWVYLRSIAVDPRSEGRGVSWKLFRAVEAEARARDAVAIYTEVSHSPPNLPSLALIKAGGLELIAEIPDPVKGFIWGLYRHPVSKPGA